ncbi:hypothetical protein PIB30_104694, partial [Stylosanthes scabra]|nr:hypothetical protein [Stylosanthes scabra]
MPSTHMRGSSTPMRGGLRLDDVRVTHMCGSCVSLLIHHAYAWFSMPMRAKDGL